MCKLQHDVFANLLLLYNMSQVKDSLLSDDPESYRSSVDQNRFDGLTNKEVWAYGIGHFINDLASTCWFNYLLYFLTNIVKTNAAPYAILSGQIADGIATPVVGFLSDRTKSRFGQRKPWYVFGLVVVLVAFLPTFQNFSRFSSNKQLEIWYYIFFPSLFNVGWAALQISHMSLVPSLTCSRKRRDKLNNLRNTFTFISNLTVLALALLIFSVMKNPTLEINLLSYIVAVLGVSASLFFIFVIDQVRLTEICTEKAEELKMELEEEKKHKCSKTSQHSQIGSQFSEGENLEVRKSKRNKTSAKVEKWSDWFKMPSFYIFGFCYMGVRLYSNLFGTLLPFYLDSVLHLGGSITAESIPFSIALIQLLIYVTSVLTSLLLSKFYVRFGRKTALMVGGILCIATATCLSFLTPKFAWPMYGIALFIGMAQSMVLATGINLISEVIGAKGKQGAFVFGIYSLLDKFASGLAIFFVSNNQLFRERDSLFIKITTIIIPSAACIMACLLVLFSPIQEYKKVGSTDNTQTRSSIQQELVQ